MFAMASMAWYMSVAMVLFYLLGVGLAVFVIYDIVMEQDRMQATEKLLWIGVVIVLNLVGVLVYLAVIRYNDQLLLEEDSLQEIERLNELREEGALTDAEFQAEKERILERRAGRDDAADDGDEGVADG